MFAPSLTVFKSLVNHGLFRTLMFKNFPVRTIDLKCNSQVVTLNMVKKNKIQNIIVESNNEEIVKAAVRLIREYPNSESIKWEELTKKLKELNMQNNSSIIFQACLRLQDIEAGINYFNYVIKSGKELTPIELVIFIKLFTRRKDQILKHESVIKQIYSNIKVYLRSSIVQNYLVDLITETPSCYYDFIKTFKEDFISLPGKKQLTEAAFKLKNPKLAYDIMYSYNVNVNEVFTSYTNYLCQMAIENKFSPDMITTFIKFWEDKNSTIKNTILIPNLLTLVNTLNKHDRNYVWKFEKCDINYTSICPKCNLKLNEKNITESDFNNLKEAFFPNAGLTNQSVFLSSTDVEIKNFLEFLESSEPYDIVCDGLNLMSVKYGSMDLPRFVQYFIDKGLRVLIIGRIHARKQIQRLAFLQKPKYKGKCQFFFVENLSDDDLFTLYATMHGGLGTKLISGDFLNKYGARFNDYLKIVFFKWKVKHQYVIFNNKLYPPLPTLGLPQLTTNENGKKFIWHLPYIPEVSDYTSINPSFALQWTCLQAEKKSKEKYGTIYNVNLQTFVRKLFHLKKTQNLTNVNLKSVRNYK